MLVVIYELCDIYEWTDKFLAQTIYKSNGKNNRLSS